jgi:hypothetical protein
MSENNQGSDIPQNLEKTHYACALTQPESLLLAGHCNLPVGHSDRRKLMKCRANACLERKSLQV